MYDYEHTQPGTMLRTIFGTILVVLTTIATATALKGDMNAAFAVGIPITILLVIASLFHSLTVRVSQNEISLSFGVGLIQKAFLTDEVESATAVRNRWYYGLGIKKIPGGWLFNVSGLDAVELRMRNGKLYRIGTDQPEELLAAIGSVVRSEAVCQTTERIKR